MGDSIKRVNPAFCTNISIVFVDEGKDLTDDCKGRQDCDGCEIQPCVPQTFEGQDQIGRPYSVIQYVYSSKLIRRQHIKGLTKAITEASVNGKYVDPLSNLYRAAKQREFQSSTKLQNNHTKTENKQYKSNTNMNKKLIRLTESDLHRIVRESVNRVLNENINDKLQFIIGIVKDLGNVHLSSKCGNYYALVDNGDTIVALKLVGANGYGTADLKKLKPQVIDVIYDDLYEDFGN